MTLTLIFNKDLSRVLMCYHRKQHAYNYVGGHKEHGESEMETSYRELQEETGITRNDVELVFIRREQVSLNNAFSGNNCWTLYITAGVLEGDIALIEENNRLEWVSVTDVDRIIFSTFGNGNCYTYMREAIDILTQMRRGE